MEWFFKPKVMLGLLVNYIFIMLTLFYPTFERTHPVPQYASIQPDPVLVPYAPLPPPAAPSTVTVEDSGGQVNVSLSNELTLVKKPGRTLVFSPSVNARTRPAQPPHAVNLR